MPGQRAKVGALLVATLVLAACAPSLGKGQVALTPEQWTQAVRARGVDPTRVANPLAFTASMQERAREAAGGTTALARLARLQSALFADDAFDYESRSTLTAREAYERRSGNCVAFTNLFIALARSLGIPAQPALVLSRKGTEPDGDLTLVTHHVIAVYHHGDRWALYDFYLSRLGPAERFRPIDDLWATAIYINNLAIDALRSGRLEQARERIEQAIRLAPGYAPLYSNLGVVLRRQGDRYAALDAYLTALQLEPGSDTVRHNLFGLFIDHGLEASETSPGDLPSLESVLTRAETDVSPGEVRAALRYYREIHRRRPLDPEPLVALGRCHLLLGRIGNARRALVEALDLDPEHASARRLLDSLTRALLEHPARAGSARRVRAETS